METTKKNSPRRTAAQWHSIVEAQQASGLSAPKFCQLKHISYPSFISWRKKLTNQSTDSSAEEPQFVELTTEPSATSSLVSSANIAHPMLIELDLGCGIQLRMSRAS